MPIKSLTAIVMFALLGSLFGSCVPKRKLVAAEYEVSRLQSDSSNLATRVALLERNVQQLENERKQLQQMLAATKRQLEATRTEATSRLEDASERLNMSQQQILSQQQRLEQLQSLIDQQRQLTMNLRKKINDALVGFNSSELSVSTKNGRVYVSLQENLLFPSGSAVVNPKGKQALSKLAEVLNANPDITVEIEGHTDSIPIRGRYTDNWDLSVARSTAIVRILTETYNVNPERVTASGRSKFDPVDENTTAEGRAKNRRTEIILEPKLDQIMQLLQIDQGLPEN